MKGRAVNAAIVEAVHDADARPVRRRIALAFQLGDLIAIERAQDFMLRLNVGRLASYPVAATAVLVCAAVLSLKIYQTPQAPSVAQIQSTVPAVQSDWNLASQVSGVMVAQPRPVFNANLSTHRKTAPPRYVLDSMPVSYESTLRF